MGALDSLLGRGLDRLTAVLLTGLAGVCFAEVVARNLGGRGLGWQDEVAGYLLVWLTFSTAALTERDGRHIGIEPFASRLGPAATRARRIIVQAAMLLLQLVVAVVGARLAWESAASRAVTVLMSMGLVYAAVPLFALVTALVHGRRLADLVREGAR